MDKTDMDVKAFISYSAKEVVWAQRVKNFLDSIGIDSFVANDDLRVASSWKDSIVEELRNRELVIPLLSRAFKESDWCSQEIGIAYIQNKKFIPISLDRTKPYGFLNHIQTRFANDCNPTVTVAEGLMELFANAQGFIHLANTSGNFKHSGEVFEHMKPFFDKFSKAEVNEIIKAAIANAQVWSAGQCQTKYIPSLLASRKSDIERLLYKKIEYQIKNNEWYPTK